MDLSAISLSLQSALLFGAIAFCVLFALLHLREARRGDFAAGYAMGGYLFLSGLYLFPWAAGHLGWYARPATRQVLFYVPFQQLLLIGPCIYLYVNKLLGVHEREKGSNLWHYLPGFLYLLYSLVVWVVDTFYRDYHFFYADGQDKDLATWYQVAGLVSMAGYTTLAYLRYRTYTKTSRQEISYFDAVTYDWVRRYLILLFVLVVLRLLFFVAYPGFGNFGQNFWYYLAYGCVAGTIGLAGYTEAVRRAAGGLVATSLTPELRNAVSAEATPYSDIAEGDLNHWQDRLEALLNEREPFRNPTLSLTDLAAMLELNRRQTSALINLRYEQNFNDFINGHRVRAIQESIQAGRHRERTLLALALEAGFNSKTTFNRVFKRETGLTPGQYQRKVGKS